MDRLLQKISFFLLLFSSLIGQEIHVIYTSAQIPKNFDLRKREYIENLNQLRSFGFDPWIIEATNTNSSFFDSLSTKVLYPQRHNDALRNKGVNEIMSMRASLPYLPFQDDDIVIKITGRYLLKNRLFIDMVKATASTYDAWGVFGKHFTKEPDLFTGCFAMRWKHLKKIIEEMDLEAAERDYIAIEILFGDFLRNEHLRVDKLRNLYVRARIFICEDNYYEF